MLIIEDGFAIRYEDAEPVTTEPTLFAMPTKAKEAKPKTATKPPKPKAAEAQLELF